MEPKSKTEVIMKHAKEKNLKVDMFKAPHEKDQPWFIEKGKQHERFVSKENDKEILAFVINPNKQSIGNYVGEIDIDNWDEADTLPPLAVDFIKEAKKANQVYSMKGLMTLININMELDAQRDFIFITNKY